MLEDSFWPFAFDSRKSIQAVAYLLRLDPSLGSDVRRLLQMLYIADRESIADTGVPITGDVPVATRDAIYPARVAGFLLGSAV
jgi:hypothetical protein